MLGCELGDDLFVLVEFVLFNIGSNHAAWTHAGFLDDFFFVERAHAGFRADSQNVVTGEGVAHRAQTVTVKAGNRPAAVKGCNRSRAVPWLHHGVGVRIERCVLVSHDAVTLRPGFRHEKRFGHRRGATSLNQHFEDSIERRRVRRAG